MTETITEPKVVNQYLASDLADVLYSLMFFSAIQAQKSTPRRLFQMKYLRFEVTEELRDWFILNGISNWRIRWDENLDEIVLEIDDETEALLFKMTWLDV